MSSPPEPICQSCAMPLIADPMGGGTELDGSESLDYCSYCYRNGSFTDPTLTMESMIEKLTPIMKSMNVPEEAAAAAIRALPKLKRWRDPSVKGP